MTYLHMSGPIPPDLIPGWQAMSGMGLGWVDLGPGPPILVPPTPRVGVQDGVGYPTFRGQIWAWNQAPDDPNPGRNFHRKFSQKLTLPGSLFLSPESTLLGRGPRPPGSRIRSPIFPELVPGPPTPRVAITPLGRGSKCWSGLGPKFRHPA